jgi:hypothetical protein
MPIYRLLRSEPFGPEELEFLIAAYEQALLDIQLTDRTKPLAETIARKIIVIGQTGLQDPKQVAKQVLEQLGLSSP